MAEVCTTCGLPKDLCVCEELEKEETRIVVRLEMRRFRKPTTMVEGLNPKRSDLEKIARELKSKLACGGTAKDGYILLQGDHRDDVRERLVTMGFTEGSIEVQ
ncbi:MAG TPA: translation initiation factor [Nitrososphaerales archaeon]|nr:translation initiation factor [Nitrososphaerales archaeon]